MTSPVDGISDIVFSKGTGGTKETAYSHLASSGSLRKNPEGTATLLPKAQHSEIKRPTYRVYDHPVETPSGSYPPGVWLHGVREDKGKTNLYDKYICSPLHVEAITSNNGTDFGRLLRFRNTLGQWCKWAMPMRLLKGSGEDLRGELLDMGVEIDPDASKLLNRYLQSQHPQRQVAAATSTGWHSPDLFIMPKRNIGTGEAIYQSDAANLDDFRQGGTLEGWRAEIGARCAGNPLLMLAVCSAIAGPLLHHLRGQGGGFHLVGDSSTGKSSALMAGCSVWGHGENFKRTWRATSNGLEGIAAQRNDTLLVLDEIGEADPREIGAVVYALANGTGKARANRIGAARPAMRWRLLLLSSGEAGLSAHMAEGGKRSRAGQEIRLLDISARRAFGAWDDLHGLPGGREFSDAIQRASVTNYGHIGPAFIEKLLESGEAGDLPTVLATLGSRFTSSNGQEGRAAERYAVVALAGELAIEWGLLPVPPGSALNAMLALYNEWRSHRGPTQREDDTILTNLTDFIDRHGDTQFSSLSGNLGVRDRAGWWKDDGGRRIWLFTSEGLKRAVPGYDIARIIDALTAAGWITERSDGKNSKRVKVDGRAIGLYHICPLEP